MVALYYTPYTHEYGIDVLIEILTRKQIHIGYFQKYQTIALIKSEIWNIIW